MKFEKTMEESEREGYEKFIQDLDESVKTGKGRFMLRIGFFNQSQENGEILSELHMNRQSQNKFLNKAGLDKFFLFTVAQIIRDAYEAVVLRERISSKQFPGMGDPKTIKEIETNPEKEKEFVKFMKESSEENAKVTKNIIKKMMGAI